MTEDEIECGTFQNSINNTCTITEVDVENKSISIKNITNGLTTDVPFERVIEYFNRNTWKNFVPISNFDLGELK